MLQRLFPKLRFALVAVVLLWIKTYIVYKLAFDIKIDNFFEEFHKPEEIKRQIFTLTRPESAQVMSELYSQVKRNKDQLQPTPEQ